MEATEGAEEGRNRAARESWTLSCGAALAIAARRMHLLLSPLFILASTADDHCCGTTNGCFSIEVNVNHGENFYGPVVSVASPEECCLRCANDAACRSWDMDLSSKQCCASPPPARMRHVRVGAAPTHG